VLAPVLAGKLKGGEPVAVVSRSFAGWSPQRRRNLVKGLLFISPWVVGLLAFTIYPVAASLYYSFSQYDVVRPPTMIGLQN